MNLNRLLVVLLVAFLLLSLGPMVVVTFTMQTSGGEILKHQVYSHLMSLTEANAQMLNRFLEERASDLKVLALGIARERSSDSSHFLPLLEATMADQGDYSGLEVLGSKGEVLAHVGNMGTSDPASEETEPGNLPEGISFFSGKRGPLLRLSLKIDEGGEGSRELRAQVDMDRIAGILKAIKVGETGEVYLIDSRGRHISSPRMGLNISPATVLHEGLPSGTSGVYEHIDYRGQMVLCAYKKIPGRDWYLIAEQDSREAFQIIMKYDRGILGMLWAAALGVGVLVFLTSRAITRKLMRQYTRSKELEAQVIHQDRLASMGLLTAGIAHELNTPLANGLLYTQMLKEELVSNGQQPLEHLDIIEEEIVQAGMIIRSLLEFSRYGSTGETTTDVNQILEKLLAICRPMLKQHNIEVQVNLGRELPRALGDPASIQQVLTNILSNAIDIMPDSGRLTVSTRHLAILHKLRIEIGDTGPGIPRRLLNNIFDPFYTTKPADRGTGLGLFVTYGIIRRLRGQIRVESCSNQDGYPAEKTGTTMIVELPTEDHGDMLPGASPSGEG